MFPPEEGSSSLELELDYSSRHSSQAAPPKAVLITESTPSTLQYRNPRTKEVSESQSAKRRKADEFTATSTPPISTRSSHQRHPTRSKRIAPLSIDVIRQMWMGFSVHKALAIQRGKHVGEAHQRRVPLTRHTRK